MKHHGNMDYKKFYKEIQNRLRKYSDVVYYEPMPDYEILDMEKVIGKSIKPLYREYLSAFGMTQDVFDWLGTSYESFLEDFDFIKASLKDYLPIFSDLELEEDEDEVEPIYLINNEDLSDNFVYVVIVGDYDKIGDLRKLKTFHQLIEESVSKLENNYKDRCPNKHKVNITEFSIPGTDFPAFVDSFKTVGLKQLTEWKPKYYPENIFGYELAIFELFNQNMIFERDDDDSQYRFELEEPLLTDKEKSIIRKTEQLLKVHLIKHEKNGVKLIEND